MSTPNYGWPLLATNQASPEITHNAAISAIDTAFGSLLVTAMADADYTLNLSATPSEASYLTYKFTGTLTADRHIIVPSNKKLYSVWNQTTTPHNLIVKTSSGTGITVPYSSSAAYVLLYCDGTNVVSIGTQSGGGGGGVDQFLPESFGAVGDGTTDDTTAMQACFNAAIVAGGTVLLSAKTYLVTSGLTLTLGYNVNIVGVNAGVSIIECNSASVDILTITGNNSGGGFSNNVFQDFAVNRSTTPSGTAKGISWSNVLWANIVRVSSRDNIYNFYQTGCANINYNDCLSDGALGGTYTQYGWYYDGTSGNNSSRNIDCLAANDSNITTVIGLTVSGANIADLYCERFETAKNDTGVSITATTHGGNSPGVNGNLHFTDCIHDQIGTSAYVITNVYDRMSYVEITGGYVQMKSGNNNPAIDIENSSGVVITGVDVLHGGGATTTTPGIYVHGSHSINNIIHGNIFRTEDAGAPIVLDTCSNNIVSNNTIYGYSGSAFSIGITLLSANSNTISGNNISGYGTTGISLDSSSGKNGGLNVVDTTNISTALSDSGTGNFVTVAGGGGGGSGTVTHTAGALTLNAVILGNGTADVKASSVLPADATYYYDGTGNFSVPGSGGGGGAASLFTKMVYTATERAIGSVYQNLTGQPIIVAGFLNMGGSTAVAVCDSGSSPTTVVNEQDQNSGLNCCFLFLVPNNYYYKVSGASSFGGWAEWKINAGAVTFSGELSGSRSLSTPYQNTSGKAMLVSVDLSGVGSGTTVTGYSDSTATPSTVVWQGSGEATGKQMLWIMVPNNDYYEVACSGAAVAHWNEYALPFNAVKSIDYATAPAQRVPAYSSALDSRSNGTQPIWGTTRDKFVAFSDGGTSGGNTIIACAAPATDPTLQMGLQCVNNNTVSNKYAAIGLLVQGGEFYQVGRDATGGTLAHWWEYTLG